MERCYYGNGNDDRLLALSRFQILKIRRSELLKTSYLIYRMFYVAAL
jgi:hypothetical protein